MINKVIEIGHVEAMQAFSMKDFKLDEKTSEQHHVDKTANDRKYFIDLDLGKILVRYYKDGEYVDTVYFQSTKAKYKAISAYYMERVYG